MRTTIFYLHSDTATKIEWHYNTTDEPLFIRFKNKGSRINNVSGSEVTNKLLRAP